VKYKNVVEATFVERLNRFVATVKINGKTETVHVKNTGRCKELLVPGYRVYLEKSANQNRKTAFDLIAVEKEREGRPPVFINMDSQAPNAAAEEWLEKGTLFSDSAKIKREVGFGSSRFDFYIEDGEKKAFLEVKGVTLEGDGIARFPDAPTERGIKHINELITAKKQGFEAYILFVIQMKEIHLFEPNYETHRKFGEALVRAQKSGVNILAADCAVTPDSITLENSVEIKL